MVNRLRLPVSTMRLPLVMMREPFFSKTISARTWHTVSDVAEAICLPRQSTQELIDMGREQRLLERQAH